MFKGIDINQLKPEYDCIIIGAGIGGLVCANYLAKAGMSVLVVERGNQPGGYCVSFVRNGYNFDPAVHLVASCGRYEQTGFILREINSKAVFKKSMPMPICFPGMRIKIFGPIDEFKDDLKSKFNQYAGQIDQFFGDVIKIYRCTLHGRKNTDHPAIIDALQITYSEFLDLYFNNAELKEAVSFLWGFLGSPPNRISALAMIYALGTYMIEGTYRIMGGGTGFG
ncbi:phytoene desaturase family protein [Candidatus Margulisiibacteriota bacterium]